MVNAAWEGQRQGDILVESRGDTEVLIVRHARVQG